MAASAVTSAAVNTTTQGDIRFTGSHTIVQWAHDVLTALGLPVTITNIAILVTWANVESGGYNPNATGGRNNPLNTTQPGHGGVGGGGQGNIMDYPSYADGVAAIAENLRNPRFGYPAILKGLRDQSASETFNAINASSFGTHINPNTQPTLDGRPGVNPAPDSPSGLAGQGATLAVDFNPFGVAEHLPVIGDLVKGGKAVQALAGFVLGIFRNWRFVLEVLGGAVLLLGGVLIIMNDLGTQKAGTIVKAVAAA